MSGATASHEDPSRGCQYCVYTKDNPFGTVDISSSGLIFCSICDFSCRLKRHVIDHAKGEHLNINLYECNVCKCKFTDKSIWKRHHLDHIDDQFSCGHCDFKSNLKNHVTEHFIDRHMREKNFVCSSCQQICDDKSGLKFVTRNSIVVHSVCTNCDGNIPSASKSTSTFENKNETSPNYFQCRFCDDKFETRSVWMKHLTSEHFKNVFTCEDCGFVCNVEKHLMMHEKSKHTAAIALNCQMCGQNFSEKSDRSKQTKKQGKVHPCPFCEYKCNILRHWIKHVREKHPEKSTEMCFHCDQTVKNKEK